MSVCFLTQWDFCHFLRFVFLWLTGLQKPCGFELTSDGWFCSAVPLTSPDVEQGLQPRIVCKDRSPGVTGIQRERSSAIRKMCTDNSPVACL